MQWSIILPLLIIFSAKSTILYKYLLISSILVISGGVAQLYVIIVGGQSFPLYSLSLEGRV